MFNILRWIFGSVVFILYYFLLFMIMIKCDDAYCYLPSHAIQLWLLLPSIFMAFIFGLMVSDEPTYGRGPY